MGGHSVPHVRREEAPAVFAVGLFQLVSARHNRIATPSELAPTTTILAAAVTATIAVTATAAAHQMGAAPTTCAESNLGLGSTEGELERPNLAINDERDLVVSVDRQKVGVIVVAISCEGQAC
jgi:hypothetical protein